MAQGQGAVNISHKHKPDSTGDELYRCYLTGDEKALKELVELYGESLTLHINGFIGNANDAEELMIEAFTQIIGDKWNFRWESSFRPYLFAIGRILALRYLKERKNESFVSFEAAEAESGKDDATPETDYLDGERKGQLHEALRKLKPEHRDVLYLIYFEDMSYAEAGRVLNKNKRQIEGLEYRARASLKKIMESEGFTYAEK